MNYLFVSHIFLIGIIAMLSIFIYILLRKRTYTFLNSIQNSNDKYRDLFENANDAIFMLDAEHNYVDVNKKAVELFGYSREEFLQLNVLDVIPSSQTYRSNTEFERLKENGKYEKFTGKQKTKDGRWLDIEVNSSIIMSNGKVVGSRDIVRDITDRKKAEEERESMIADLKKALEEIRTLKGILPLCSFCKKIRNNNGEWKSIDVYIQEHSEADITHTVCPSCMKKHYPNYSKNK